MSLNETTLNALMPGTLSDLPLVQTLDTKHTQEWAPYRVLEKRNDEIRCLHLIPGAFEDELRCDLSKVSLRDNPQYEALSYTWGLGNLSKRPLYVDGVRFEITSNLETALRHLQYKQDIRILWVDAICINQKDVDERGSQVSQMGLIYSTAQKTVIYLGNADEECKTALDLLVTFSKDKHFTEIPIWKDQAKTQLDLVKLRSLEKLWSHQWWSRIWVVQEVCLARKICCLERIAPSDMVEANKILADHNHVTENQNTDRINIQHEKVPNVLLLLKTYREREAIDPRDKVYGILGMAFNSAEVEIVADYSISWQELYTRTIVQLVQSYQQTDLLSTQSLGLSLANMDVGLPSWVPNWSISQYKTSQTCSHYWHSRHLLHYRAGSGIPFLVMRIPETNFICVNGIFLDEIAEVSEVLLPEGPDDEDIPALRNTFQNWEEKLAENMRDSKKYITGGTWQEAFWKTVAADLIAFIHSEIRKGDNKQPGHTVEEMALRFFLLIRYTFGIKSSLRWPEPYREHGRSVLESAVQHNWDGIKRVKHMHSAIENRIFCLTKSGCFGTVPKETQLGDSVHIVGAASTPFVLRKGNIQVKGRNKLGDRIVGDAHFHGVMDGEASRGKTPYILKYLLY
ncbi:hypothetical protein ONS95_006758 [Cadophora gregata]|uniref:uncharacterized protein n=1 Tax=Cadophora gregata TaxID=51156 RepID=UPI0026DB604A|nr:uncharacterized protein ONS95_006758 [Cadophora gregata]KAK0101595.1 hypothetical protein ONS95_006758 [Cadophora gregata]KAK0106391.1 hypothetical protein ONS96_004023 [Cadophora gregata f. sp. sojae]